MPGTAVAPRGCFGVRAKGTHSDWILTGIAAGSPAGKLPFRLQSGTPRGRSGHVRVFTAVRGSDRGQSRRTEPCAEFQTGTPTPRPKGGVWLGMTSRKNCGLTARDPIAASPRLWGLPQRALAHPATGLTAAVLARLPCRTYSRTPGRAWTYS